MSSNSDQCSKSRGFKKGIKLWNEIKLLFGHNDYVMANSKSKTLLGKKKVQWGYQTKKTINNNNLLENTSIANYIIDKKYSGLLGTETQGKTLLFLR